MRNDLFTRIYFVPRLDVKLHVKFGSMTLLRLYHDPFAQIPIHALFASETRSEYRFPAPHTQRWLLMKMAPLLPGIL